MCLLEIGRESWVHLSPFLDLIVKSYVHLAHDQELLVKEKNLAFLNTTFKLIINKTIPYSLLISLI